MKNKAVRIISLIILLGGLGGCMFRQVVLPHFRFSTVEEAFRQSAPWGARLCSVLEDKGVAVVLYEENSVTIISSMTGRDEKGWLPLLENVSYKRHVSQGDIHVYIYEEYGKYTLCISAWYPTEQALPKIHDTLNSSVKSYVIQASSKMKIVKSLIVSEKPFPEDYRLFCDDKTLTL